MSLKERFNSELTGQYDGRELESMWRYFHDDERLSEQWLSSVIRRLKEKEPLQYILGYSYFYDVKLLVDKSVLIPRPETEELITKVYKECEQANLLDGHILDIGSGSGCIAISLAKKMPKSHVMGIDVSIPALNLARKNARLNNVENVRFEWDNILNSRRRYPTLSAIVSNPPYIRPSDAHLLDENVLNFEPHLALFADEKDVVNFYRVIAEFALQHLQKNGKLFLEINEHTSDQILDLLSPIFTSIVVEKDLQGKQRMIVAAELKD